MLEVNMDELLQPWVGDLPGMLDRRVIRVLTTYSKTFFFINKGTPRGATHDVFMAFERELNARLLKEDKLKQRHLKVRIIFVRWRVISCSWHSTRDGAISPPQI
ncbi:hypothetical protein P2W74_20940 [Citrobacter enshiensis]|nr:hypothetical protein [Citrobacter enshiensis]WET40288.1 hypothetical protein P2W74_20940 [Citrobacter enshiensis]